MPAPTGSPPVDPPPVDPPPVEVDECAAVVPQPSPVILSRLTRTEYIRTIQDLFGVDMTEEAADLPYEIRAPFTTTAVAQSTDIQHLEVFSTVAAKVATTLGAFAPTYADCAEFTEVCERTFVGELGAFVFRRPLRTAEVEAYRSIFRIVEAESDTFQTAASLVLRSMLQSPQFLYHLEDRQGDGVRELAPHELARRLAYLVWRSTPDDALVAAAAAGTLTTDAQIEAQVRRLAADPRAEEASLAFFEDWVDLTRLERAVRGLDDGVRVQMREETERVVRSVLWTDNKGLADLVGVQYTFLTPALAERYGLTSTTASAGEWHRYDLRGVPSRRGILTQGSLLAAHANGNRPAFVSRGLFLLRSLLCRDVPNPSAGVDTNITDLPETASERAKSAERISRGSCGPCHSTFDPLAYAFEGYTGFGVLTDVDPNGNAVQKDGWLPEKFGAAPDTPQGRRYPYDDVDGLIDRLIDAPFFHRCMAEKPLGFAIRRRIDDVLNDRCAVRTIAEATEARGGSYVDLLVSIATHPIFTRIAVSEDE